MAVDIATIGLAVDTKDLSRGSRELDNFGKSANKASGEADKSSKSMAGMGVAASRLIGLLGSAGLVTSLVKVADQYTKLNAQLNIASRSQADYAKSLQDVIRISNLAQTNLNGTATLYSRLANTLKDTNVTQQQFANITESVALGLRVSGAGVAESESAMLQLSQAFASGVLRGEEFNAVSEASFPLMEALAKSMNKPIEQLRDMAQNGEITRDALVTAFSDPALIATFTEQAKELNTVSGAFQVLKNNLTVIVGELNKTTGASNGLAAALLSLANSPAIKVPFQTLAVLGVNVAYVFNQVGREIGGIAAQLAALITGDFKGAKFIGEQMKRDAAAARIEVDKLSESIINPKIKDSPIVAEVKKLKEATTQSNVLTKAQQKEISDARKKAQAEYIKTEDEFMAMTLKFDKLILGAENDRLDSVAKERAKALEIQRKSELDAADEVYRAQKAHMEDLQREQERFSRDLSRSITDALFRGFESGKDFLQNFKDTVINAFQTLVIRPQIEAIISTSGIGGLGASLFSGSANAATGDNGGLFQSLSNIGSNLSNGFDNLNLKLIEGIAGFGDKLSGFGLEKIGGFINTNSTLIGKLAPFAGAALQLAQGNIGGAIGTAIGSYFGPVGGAIGSFLGSAVGGLFGSKKQPPRTGSSGAASFNNGTLTSSTSALAGRYTNNSEMGQALQQGAAIFSQSVGSILKAFGLNSNVSANASYAGRAGGSGYGAFSANVGGRDIAINNKYKDQFGQETFNQFMTEITSKAVVDAIQSSELSGGIKGLFADLTDINEIQTMIKAVIGLRAKQDLLAKTYDINTNKVAQAAISTGVTGVNLVKFLVAVRKAAESTLTIGDQLVAVQEKLTKSFKGTLPTTLKDFDLALKNIDKSTQKGIKQFADLFLIREQFAAFTQNIDTLKGGVKGALFGIVSDAEKQQMLQADLAKLFGDLGRDVPASIQELINLGKTIDFTTKEGLDLAAVFPSLVQAFNETKGAVDSLLSSLNPSNFRTFADYVVGSSLASQGVPISRIPQSGLATPFIPNTQSSSGGDNGQVANLLQALLIEMRGLNQTSQATAESTRRTASELELITEGSVTLNTTGV